MKNYADFGGVYSPRLNWHLRDLYTSSCYTKDEFKNEITLSHGLILGLDRKKRISPQQAIICFDNVKKANADTLKIRHLIGRLASFSFSHLGLFLLNETHPSDEQRLPWLSHCFFPLWPSSANEQ